jgi:DNA-binding transcriptional ArsR family regulator
MDLGLSGAPGHLAGMAKPLHHPEPNRIDLSAVLDALSDPIRRAIVRMLAEQGEGRCSDFLPCTTKTNLTYHVARLREAGVIFVRPDGAARIATLRRQDLDARFPGLLDAVLAGARQDPPLALQAAEE